MVKRKGGREGDVPVGVRSGCRSRSRRFRRRRGFGGLVVHVLIRGSRRVASRLHLLWPQGVREVHEVDHFLSKFNARNQGVR